MKYAIFLCLFIIISPSTHGQKDFYSTRWSEVYKNELKDLPQSALKIVDTLYSQAKKDQNATEITKALLYQSKFALTLQENAELIVIQKFTKEIEASRAPLKNVLQSMIAQIYWQYFQANRWKYYNRTTAKETPNPDDFRTWDAPAMLQEIDKYLKLSLADEKLLQNTKLDAFNDILALADQSKRYRPTLYDFLGNNALDFYEKDERGLQDRNDESALDLTRYYPPIDTISLDGKVNSGKYAALRLFRNLLVFHSQRKDTSAYLNLEIERIKFIREHSPKADDTEAFRNALRNLKSTYGHHPTSTLIDLELATLFFKEGALYGSEDSTYLMHKKISLGICNDAITKFPNGDGAAGCKALRERILSKDVSVKAEKLIPISKPSRMLVSYTNLSKLFTRIYRVSPEFERTFMRTYGDSSKLALLSSKQIQNSWQSDLPKTDDYQTHTTELVLPALSQGLYLIVASETADLLDKEQILAYTSVQVTNLALIELNIENLHRFQVVDRNSGKPLAGVDVIVKSVRTDNDRRSDSNHKTTDKNGFIEFDKSNGSWELEVNVAYAGDTLLLDDYYHYNYRDNSDRKEKEITAKAFLFTDRSIYRPGQTVFFKGILVKTKEKKSSVVSGEYVEVLLDDVNAKEVGLLRLKTNAYGSFSGEFKLPTTGLTGEYQLTVDEDSEEDSKFYDKLTNFEQSETRISVEEYKRPTFEVTMKPVTGTYRLNDTIRVVGQAAAYSASQISKAKVTYTVKREVRYPRWYYWNMGNSRSEPQEIAHGEVITNEKGEFTIPFQAIPDSKVAPNTNPVFSFLVSVSVTDINGETRNGESRARVGYHSMTASITTQAVVDIQKATSPISISTENLNGQFLPAMGTINIYKLQGPSKPVRKRPWPAPDSPTISKGEFERLFPNESNENQESQPSKWVKGKLIAELPFDTKKTKEVNLALDHTWNIGTYVMELHTKDSTGQAVEDKFIFELTNSKSKLVPDNSLLLFQTDKNSYTNGEVVKLTIGSAAADANVTIEIEKNNKIVKTYTEHLSAGTKEIHIPVTAVSDGAFSIHCSAVIFNSFIEQHKTLTVEADRPKFSIETETFKDKLQPGSKETWSFIVNGEDGQKVEAEVLASMYDASLDQFKPHEWSFNPIQRPYHYSQYRINARQSFSTAHFIVKNIRSAVSKSPQQNYDAFDWFGFSIADRHNANRLYRERLYTDRISTGKPSKVIMRTNKNGRLGFISGQVTDSGGKIPGVSISIKGTQRGTATDANGHYSIQVNKDDVLIFSFIGYNTTEVKIGSKNIIDVTMEPAVMQLSEVVVVGYGVQTRRALTGAAIYVVKDSKNDGFSLQEAMEGKAQGVSVMSAEGMRYKISIRGNSKLGGGNEPLYVVDGEIVETSTIDKNDIQSVTVLRGEEATALYGAKATNGVIVITTKSGQQMIDNELSKVTVRQNFNETAFFYPQLSTDENGKVRFSFTTPESLTRWKIQLLAHTRDLLTTTKTLQAVSQKELMVTPNLPRFVRVGDELIIAAKIANLSEKKVNGKAGLVLTNAVTGASVDQLFGHVQKNKDFKTDAKGSTQISWRIKVPAGVDAIQYKIVAKAGDFSDGEQNVLPVLSNRMLVTETMPLYVRSDQTKTFTLDKLQNQLSATLQNHQLTLEITSNPAWYAIQSLPYLMEFPHECAEQTFSRIYANSIASHIINSNPKIKLVFDKWQGSGALTSNLEKNQELKSIIIEETPWLRDAENEAEQKKRIALLFDLKRMNDHLSSTVDKLKDMQFKNGAFPWFTGSKYEDRYITQHIASAFGHLEHLKINTSKEMKTIIAKSMKYLDAQIVKDFKEITENVEINAPNIKAAEKKSLTDAYLTRYQPGQFQIHYLYMRSFYTDIVPDKKTKEAIDYFQKQTAAKWLSYTLYEKGMIALIQQRCANKGLAQDIVKSLKENAVTSDELGMYWKENKGGWYWYEAQVETQALMIEAFAEIQADDQMVSETDKQKTIDELRVWLLKNKQTNAWRTTKATTEAAYALLLNGSDWLSLDKSVQVKVGSNDLTIDPSSPEAGTGYFKTTWKGAAVSPDKATVTISKTGKGISWGGVYWQYFENLDKITNSETPLKLKKSVYKVINTDKGEQLNPIKTETLKPGDLIRIRIELSADRDMEYLHMKDMRASGFEPVDVLSGYKWQEGLGYYQSTRDAATNFFFDHVLKGVYVFEYDLRVNVKGNFSNGITTIQSMYAPEFSSHSEGIRVVVE